MTQKLLESLKKALDKSNYTVAICGSGMLKECGYLGMKDPELAYDLEHKYGVSPEYIFSSAYYNTRTADFFKFYINEVINVNIKPSESSYTLAAMERVGKLQCVISSNIYELSQRGGCKNVINLHGSIYKNRCPHCGKEYSLDDMRQCKKIPFCRECGTVIRPMVSLFGEMLDNQIMTKTTEEIEKAEVLLVLGTTLSSDVYQHYIRYFTGSCLAIIHEDKHDSDKRADIVIYDMPKNILPQLGY